MNPFPYLLIALLKTSGEGGTVQIGYADAATCEAAGQRLEAQFEAVPMEHADGSPAKGSPRVVWTCFAVSP